jgi:hypothetical protein
MSAIKNPPNAEFSALTQPKQIYAKDFERGAWTYDSSLPYYGTMGVERGIAKAIAQMDKLHALFSEKHIGLSVGVYPWRSSNFFTTRRSLGRSRFGGNGVTRDANGFSITSQFSSLTSASIRTFSGGYSFGETFTKEPS